MLIPLAQSSDVVQVALFYLFAAFAAGGAIGVVLTRNIVRMAVYLLFTLAGVAGLYFLMHAEFLAAVQLVVYAGGTLILIVFGVMLTSKSPFSKYQPSGAEVAAAVIIGIAMLGGLVLGLGTALGRGVFASNPARAGAYPMNELGLALLGEYLVPFEIASVLLLAVMIGAAYLAKARKKNEH